MRIKQWLTALALSVLVGAGAPSEAAAQAVKVTLPDFPVTLNGYELEPLYDEYPVVTYRGITYFPMTYDYGGFLGLAPLWQDNTLTVNRVIGVKRDLRWYEKQEANHKTDTAVISTANVVLNGQTIQSSQEPYPLLQFRDVTYFPLTWRFAVQEFGWTYAFDAQTGLVINSKSALEREGKADFYVIEGNSAAGYPANSYDDQYTFTVKIGDQKERAFSLEDDLRDGDYYFHAQVDENGCFHQFSDSPIKPVIKGDMLTMPCVRQNEGEQENLLLTIDLRQGKIISKSAV